MGGIGIGLAQYIMNDEANNIIYAVHDTVTQTKYHSPMYLYGERDETNCAQKSGFWTIRSADAWNSGRSFCGKTSRRNGMFLNV